MIGNIDFYAENERDEEESLQVIEVEEIED